MRPLFPLISGIFILLFVSACQPAESELPPARLHLNYFRGSPPDFKQETDIQARKEKFIGYFLPVIKQLNSQLEQQQATLGKLQSKSSLSEEETGWLKKMAAYYRVDRCTDAVAECIRKLRLKADEIPPSLVLAQAATESAWGTSRFALHGNNYFGEWCFTKGCGMVPRHRESDAVHEVKTFPNPVQSFESYFMNLNSNSQYFSFRQLRAALRAEKNPLDGDYLVRGLRAYSERSDAYTESISDLIRQNQLSRFD